MTKRTQRVLWVFIIVILAGGGGFLYLRHVVYLDPPEVDESLTLDQVRVEEGVRRIGDNWIRQREEGLWEMYVEGDPYQRGLVAGRLSEELIRYQEEVFVKQIRALIPSDFYLRFLRFFIGVWNRNLPDHIPLEYLQEIYGISRSASSDFNDIAPPYMRLLNYHAAHDLGHLLQDYALVGCTSFATWGKKSANGELLAARNFDFYFGEGFARHKIVQFVNPAQGHAFAFVTWGGMIGVVSGMNQQGLCVTINAAKSAVPGVSATPVSILAREILQYAGNMDEAVEIARKRNVFVSESFLITSSQDGYAAIIEKSPDAMDVVYPDTNYILCANHYQSDTFFDDPVNVKNREDNATGYRFQRLQELIERHEVVDQEIAVAVLRNKKGLQDQSIGLGNEKAINQLLAHHGVVFLPGKRMMYVSTHPHVSGQFIGYQLDSVWLTKLPPDTLSAPLVKADPFLTDSSFFQYEKHKQMYAAIQKATEENRAVSADTIRLFEKLNPHYYKTYQALGDYYRNQMNCEQAALYYRKALQKEINNQANRSVIQERLASCQ